MNRGDRREPIFRDDLDYKKFLTTLAEVCTKTDWQVPRALPGDLFDKLAGDLDEPRFSLNSTISRDTNPA
jgi:hypothetical protein